MNDDQAMKWCAA